MTPRLVRWMDGRKGKLARERNGAIWREGGGGADRFGSERERDRDLNVSLLDTQKPDCAVQPTGRKGGGKLPSQG